MSSQSEACGKTFDASKMRENGRIGVSSRTSGNLPDAMENSFTSSTGTQELSVMLESSQRQQLNEAQTRIKSQDVQTQRVKSQQNRRSVGQFKLISVTFKEAALDSPSFRATVNHMDCQVNNIEQWLLALSSSIKKIPRYVKEMDTFCNSFLEHLAPGFLQDGMIDQEYTVQALHITMDGLKILWNQSLSVLRVNPQILNHMSEFRSTQVARYRDLRKKYESCQRKYDKYLSIFVSTSKSKDATMVVEDAQQLQQVRKEYVQVSLDLVVELQNIASKLDKLLVALNSTFWERIRDKINGDGCSDELEEQYVKIQSVQAWCDSYSEATKTLNNDMLSARKQVEEGANLQFQPSLDPQDYVSSNINYRFLSEIDESGIEKHGYLFMKTWVEKSSKPKWVPRWCFIKDGVFGMLLLSPSETFVQESDKIGILLCNVKYSSNEDRRFCFEIKTSELTITLQAESLIELKSWLKVFENERERVTATDPDDNLFRVASNRFPPILSEFASTVDTTMDRELSNLKIINSVGQTISSSSLSRYIEKYEKFHERHMYYQIPRLHPPIMTDTTKSAMIAYSCIAPTVLPTALTANIWGSVNWGLYYLYDSEKKQPVFAKRAVLDQEMVQFQDKHLGKDVSYPDFYPKNLINLDIQMRALFEKILQPGEYCVMSFSCIWTPNSRQELSGRCFVTMAHAYFYNQALGFVALNKEFVRRLVSIDCNIQKNYYILKIYDVDGVIKLKLFSTDGKLVKRKLTYLIECNARDNPSSLQEVFSAFSKIEDEVETEERDQKLLKKINDLNNQLSSKRLINNKFAFNTDVSSIVPNSNTVGTARRVEFTQEYDLLSEKVYNIPPKAVFHAFLGDDSAVFKDRSAITKLGFYVRKPWRNNELTGHLYRQANIPILYTGEKKQLHFEQEIEIMDDNSYYTFTHGISDVQFFVGSPFKIIQRFVIVAISGKRTKVFYYAQVRFQRHSLLNPLIRLIIRRINVDRFYRIHQNLKDAVKAVGHHGMIVKAIYLYGKLSHTTKDEEVEPIPLMKIGFLYCVQLLFRKVKYTSRAFINWLVVCFVQSIKFAIKLISVNYVFIMAIIGLSLLNVMLVGKSSINYWTAQKASNLITDYISKNSMMLQRAVYSKDIQDFISTSITTRNSSKPNKSFNIFKKSSFLYNFANSSSLTWNDYYSDDTLSVAKSLKSSFQSIGVKRHHLLVQLKILDNMEKELCLAEYVNWLMSEIQRCDYMQENILDQFVNAKETGNNHKSSQSIQKILDYCSECRNTLEGLI